MSAYGKPASEVQERSMPAYAICDSETCQIGELETSATHLTAEIRELWDRVLEHLVDCLLAKQLCASTGACSIVEQNRKHF
jgi:hypothetical protein